MAFQDKIEESEGNEWTLGAITQKQPFGGSRGMVEGTLGNGLSIWGEADKAERHGKGQGRWAEFQRNCWGQFMNGWSEKRGQNTSRKVNFGPRRE
jgi:hypothetical protein